MEMGLFTSYLVNDYEADSTKSTLTPSASQINIFIKAFKSGQINYISVEMSNKIRLLFINGTIELKRLNKAG